MAEKSPAKEEQRGPLPIIVHQIGRMAVNAAMFAWRAVFGGGEKKDKAN